MTEAEWLACDDPRATLGTGPCGGSPRKMRLFAVLCCRCSRSIMANRDFRTALQISEDFADGLASEAELRAIYEPLNALALDLHGRATDESAVRRWAECAAVVCATKLPVANVFDAAWMVQRAAEADPNEQLAALARDIFGNPFRWPLTPATLPPVASDPRWRWLWLPLAFVPEWCTDTVVATAQSIYAERAFDQMPILADALQDAGCNNEVVLAHCRDPQQVHVRGCWVVDLVLGRA